MKTIDEAGGRRIWVTSLGLAAACLYLTACHDLPGFPSPDDPTGGSPSVEPPPAGPGCGTTSGAGGAVAVGPIGAGGAGPVPGGFGGAAGGGPGGSGGFIPDGCHCTRRPSGPNSFQCPVGVGESVTVTVDAAGATISLTGRQGQASGVPFSLDIPPGALSAPTTLTITETTIAPPAGYIDYSPVYRVEPLDTTFAYPVPIVVPWGNVNGTVSAALALYAAPDPSSAFFRVADSYTNAGFEQGSVTRGGLFFVGYPGSNDPSCP